MQEAPLLRHRYWKGAVFLNSVEREGCRHSTKPILLSLLLFFPATEVQLRLLLPITNALDFSGFFPSYLRMLS